MNAFTGVSRQADIVVVGGGGTGLAAAIEAAGAGRKVILLEKEPKLGGTTGRSVGSITASGTRLQKSAGVVDDAQAHFEDMPLFAPHLANRDNLELRRLLVDNVPDVVAWLERLGVVFFGPMPEPPHRVPRMHNILPSSKSYIHYLEKEARRLGVEIVLQAKADRLVQQDGRVTVVEASVAGRLEAFRASRSEHPAEDAERCGHDDGRGNGSPALAPPLGRLLLNGDALHGLVGEVARKPLLRREGAPEGLLPEFWDFRVHGSKVRKVFYVSGSAVFGCCLR